MTKKPAIPESRDERRAVFLAMIEALEQKRAELLSRLQALDAELAEYGVRVESPAGRPNARRSPAGKARPPREGSVKAYILQTLGAEPTGTLDLASAVRRAGYDSDSKSFEQGVGIAAAELARAGLIRKVGRGTWAAVR